MDRLLSYDFQDGLTNNVLNCSIAFLWATVLRVRATCEDTCFDEWCYACYACVVPSAPERLYARLPFTRSRSAIALRHRVYVVFLGRRVSGGAQLLTPLLISSPWHCLSRIRVAGARTCLCVMRASVSRHHLFTRYVLYVVYPCVSARPV